MVVIMRAVISLQVFPALLEEPGFWQTVMEVCKRGPETVGQLSPLFLCCAISLFAHALRRFSHRRSPYASA
jgi:hypothetical protein